MTVQRPTFVPSSSARPPLPTMYDLPSENPEEPGLPDEFHDWQAQLLSQTFRPATYPPNRVFTAADLNLYYDSLNTSYYKRPDWFAVVGVPRIVDTGRLSYVVWQEGRSPLVVVELLSPSTQEEDQGQTLRGQQPPSKWEVYESILRVPYYVLFDRNAEVYRLFVLHGGSYQQSSESRLWLDELQSGLGIWEGSFNGVERQWLRWYDAEDNWLPTLAEQTEQERQKVEQEHQRAEQEYQRAEQEKQRAEQEKQRADRLAERLRQLGIDPDNS